MAPTSNAPQHARIVTTRKVCHAPKKTVISPAKLANPGRPHPAKAAINKAIAATKRAGHKVALTLSDPFCVGRWREEFLHLWKNDLDILFANEEEAKALFEVEDFDAALQSARHKDGILALTRSEKGCVVASGNELHVLDAEPVARVVDTTGAGDQFAAGFLYGLTHGQPLDRCGRLGAKAAAEVISHYGARPETSLAKFL